MAILVDRAIWRRRGRAETVGWAHLVSDASYEELHAFAARLGLRRTWFQGDHYDVPAHVRAEALALGAEPVDAAELVRRLRAAGLRRPRRGGRREALANADGFAGAPAPTVEAVAHPTICRTPDAP